MNECVKNIGVIPWYAVVIICVIISGLIVFLVSKQVSVKIGNLTLEQHKKDIKDNEDNTVRLKIHAQIREYENYTGLIERNLYEAFEKTFSELTYDERKLIHLFCNLIRRALEKQIMLDLVANHIVNKTEEELKQYTTDKTQGYKNRILNFLSNYNDFILPEKDILQVVNNIDFNNLESIYYTIYTKAVKIAKQG